MGNQKSEKNSNKYHSVPFAPFSWDSLEQYQMKIEARQQQTFAVVQ